MNKKEEIFKFLKTYKDFRNIYYNTIINIIPSDEEDFEEECLIPLEDYFNAIIESNPKLFKKFTLDEVFESENQYLFRFYLNQNKSKMDKNMKDDIDSRIESLEYENTFESFDSVFFDFLSENGFDDLISNN